MKKAILYVAGRATRLGAFARERPKSLLEFGGLSLFERHVRALAQLKISQLFVVTGHKRELLAERFPALQSRYRLQITELFNPDYIEGSALSMYASLPVLENAGPEILLMDGDVLYDSRILQRLAHANEPTALLVDRNYSTADDDPVLVPMRGGKPFDFVKKWRGEAESVGESVGFFKVHERDLPLLIEQTRKRAEGPARTDSYDDILRELVLRGCFGAEDITGIPWTEIDFPDDLTYANEVILPALGNP